MKSPSSSMFADAAMSLDPILMARMAGVEPMPWQAEALRSGDQREAWLVSRQGGKSTAAALLGVHQALYHPPASVLLISPGQRQSVELLRKCRGFLVALGRDIIGQTERASALQIELANGSRLLAMPGNETTIRGATASLILEDEAARVPDEMHYAAVRPMLATTGGRLILLSTGYGAEGHFAEALQPGSGYTTRVIPATEIPIISPEFLADELASMGRTLFEREYMTSLAAIGGGMFDMATLRRLANPAARPLHREVTP